MKNQKVKQPQDMMWVSDLDLDFFFMVLLDLALGLKGFGKVMLADSVL